jgi:hypothetical protein
VDVRARTWRRLFSRDADFCRLAFSWAGGMRRSLAFHAPAAIFPVGVPTRRNRISLRRRACV